MLTVASVAGCSSETTDLPDRYRDLVGTWQTAGGASAGEAGPAVYAFLTIEADGTISYAWYEAGEQGDSCTVIARAALTAIDDEHLEAQPFWPLSTELRIHRHPRQDGERWSMIVEGIELERVSPEVESRAGRFSCSDGRLVRPQEAPSQEDEDGDDSNAI